MAEIDAGSTAENRGSYTSYNYTCILLDNPANDTGTLDTAQIYAVSGYNMNNVRVGVATQTGDVTQYTCWDYEIIGNVTGGSMQEFTGLDIDVDSGDLAAIYTGGSNGRIEADTSGEAGYYRAYANYLDDDHDQNTYSVRTDDTVSLYMTGETASGWTTISKLNGKTATDYGKVLGTAVASIAKVCGVSTT